MKYSIVHICGILQGEFLQQRQDDAIEHLLLDSRRLIFPDDSLFFALKGPRRDAHLFIEELYKRGVRNFVVERKWKFPGSGMKEANIIGVDDTLDALQKLAAYHRSQFTLPVVGITGSNGKTIVKEWLNQLLEDEFHIVRSPKSYNSQIGVPLSVWPLNESHELAIFEAGISRPGEMQRLETIIRPTIGLFTNIGEAHSEGFASLAAKAAEKARLFDHAQAIIYCRDQPEVRHALAHSPAEHFSWGHDEAAKLVILSIEKKEGSTTIRARHAGREFPLIIPFTDEASIENGLHCVCVLLWLGRTPEQIGARLQGLSGVSMRLELKSGVNQCSIINDSYSA
ncbi:MAG TPA: Mur ligase family protein, partial [Puia sp.]